MSGLYCPISARFLQGLRYHLSKSHQPLGKWAGRQAGRLNPPCCFCKCQLEPGKGGCICELLPSNKLPYNLTASQMFTERNTYYCTHSWGSGTQKQLGGPGSGSLKRLESGRWLGPLSSDGMTVTGGSASKMLHSQGYWLEGSIPHQVDPSTGLLWCPCNMVAGFLQSH